jgi:hypothetical protein
MDSNNSTLHQAAEKAAGELVAANGVLAKGASIEESSEKLKDGASDFANEFAVEATKGSAQNDIVYLKFDRDFPLTAFRISTCGKFLIPILDDIHRSLGTSTGVGVVDTEEIKRRNQVAKDGAKAARSLIDPAKELRNAIGYPRSSEPRIRSAIGGNSGLEVWGTIVTIGIIAYFKKIKEINRFNPE